MAEVTKTIRLQEQVTVWAQRTIEVDCPEGETDEETYARIRANGTDAPGVYETGDNEYLTDTEESIGNPEKSSNQTLDFETEGLGVRE